jgi:hypothetical protein
MNTEAILKQRIAEEMGGYTIAGMTTAGKKTRKPSKHNKMVRDIMKQYGVPLGEASRMAAKMAGSSAGEMLRPDRLTAGSDFYDGDKFAKIEEERKRRRAIEDIELETEKQYALARENALANDPRYGQYIKVEKDYNDKKKTIQALKKKDLAPEQKMALRLKYESENPPKFSELDQDFKYVPQTKDEKIKLLKDQIKLIEGKGRKKK